MRHLSLNDFNLRHLYLRSGHLSFQPVLLKKAHVWNDSNLFCYSAFCTSCRLAILWLYYGYYQSFRLFGIPYSPFISATCGSAAGSVAAAITTPLDVTKTRIMLNEEKNPPGVILTLRNIAREGGVKLLYSGVLPRTLWMGIGGFIYFGAYELMMKITFWLYPKVV